MASFGHLIRAEREKRKWTQIEFGTKIGINSSAISRIENGSQKFSKSKLKKLAELFQTDLQTISDLFFADKFVKEAMEKQMRAERDRRALVLEAEGQKKASILEAEGIKESEIKKAEGEKQSDILRAEGTAQARIKIADAESEAIKLISQAIDTKNGNPINYLIAVKYIVTLKEMVTGEDNKTIYMPFEATGVLSSLGGIKEMLNQK